MTLQHVARLGGLVTIPLALPTNIASVVYAQLRLAQAIAVLVGHDPASDEVRAVAYAVLAENSVRRPLPSSPEQHPALPRALMLPPPCKPGPEPTRQVEAVLALAGVRRPRRPGSSSSSASGSSDDGASPGRVCH